MDGARSQTVSLAEAMEVAWSDCRKRLDSVRGGLSDQIAEKADLAAALHRAGQVRHMLLEDAPAESVAGRQRP